MSLEHTSKAACRWWPLLALVLVAACSALGEGTVGLESALEGEPLPDAVVAEDPAPDAALLPPDSIDEVESERPRKRTTADTSVSDSLLKPISANASADDGNPPANTLDGSYATRWSCYGVGCWLRLDLGMLTQVSAVDLAWYVGNARSNNFVVALSPDGTSFTQVYAGTSSGTSLALERYSFAAAPARFIRVTVNGNTSNAWASITEARAFGHCLPGSDGQCSVVQPPAPDVVAVAVAVSPTTASLTTGSTRTFTAAVTGSSNTAVTWAVHEGAAGGSITAAGLYTAPAVAGTYHAVATSQADSTKSATATVTVTASGIVPVDPTLRTVAQWETLFVQTFNVQHPSIWLPLSTSGNSWKYYDLAYAVDGLTAMFEATGNLKYLDGALLYVRNVIASAVRSYSLPNSQYKDTYLGWGAWDHPTDASINGGEYPLYESYCFRYAAKLLRAMRDNPAIYADSAYRRTYDEVLAFIKTNIFDKWLKRGIGNVYRGHTHMAAHWAFISLELWLLTADPIERAKYRTVLDNINLHMPNYPSSLRGQMRLNGGAYFWNAVFGSYSSPGQDVAHGNNVLAYIVEAHDQGVEWTDADIHAFIQTLLSKIWIPTSTGYRYAEYVDGSGTGGGWFNDGFCKLGRYDATIQKRLEQHTVGRNVCLYGNGALNAKILNGR